MNTKANSLNAFLKLAKDLDSSEPLIALCCRVTYIEKFLAEKKKIGTSPSPAENKDLSELFTTIEAQKKQLNMTREQTKEYLEKFCLKSFADIDQDYNTVPKVTREHAMRFNKVSHFIELLPSYDAMTPKWEEICKILSIIVVKYSKMKAGTILKCIKQGIDPPRENPPANNQLQSQQPQSFHHEDPQSIQLQINPENRSSLRRKVDKSNPYNEDGKIIRQHPKYFEVLDAAQKLMEQSLGELKGSSYLSARGNIKKAYDLLDQLEN